MILETFKIKTPDDRKGEVYVWINPETVSAVVGDSELPHQTTILLTNGLSYLVEENPLAVTKQLLGVQP